MSEIVQNAAPPLPVLLLKPVRIRNSHHPHALSGAMPDFAKQKKGVVNLSGLSAKAHSHAPATKPRG